MSKGKSRKLELFYLISNKLINYICEVSHLFNFCLFLFFKISKSPTVLKVYFAGSCFSNLIETIQSITSILSTTFFTRTSILLAPFLTRIFYLIGILSKALVESSNTLFIHFPWDRILEKWIWDLVILCLFCNTLWHFHFGFCSP